MSIEINKVTPTTYNKEEEIQEIMAVDQLSSSPYNKKGILEQLLNIKRTILLSKEENETPYKIFLSEYENYQKDISYENFEAFKENVKKRLSKDTVKLLALREEKHKMPILNFFAYFREIEVMEFIFELFSDVPIEIFPDFENKDFLEIALELNNKAMIDLIIRETSKNPPSFGCWKNLSMKVLKQLFDKEIDNMGTFIDSRVFPIMVDKDLKFSGHFFYTNSLIINQLPLSESIIKDHLIQRPGRNELEQNTEFRFVDIKEFVYSKDFLFDTINDNYPGENDLYGSNALQALANHHWLSYGYVCYLIKLVIFALEFLFFFKITDYLRSDPSLPSEKGGMVVLILVVFYLIIVFEFHTEISELRKSGLRKYFRSDDNIIDVMAITTYLVMVIFYTLQYHYILTSYPPEFFDKKLVVQGFFYFFMALRILWMFQVFPGMGFYIRMTAYMIRYIFQFFWFFILLIIIVCFSFAGVAGNEGLTQDASWNFGNFYRVYKAALGDSSDFMQIIDNSFARYGYVYFLYYVVSIVLQIIMLNIVITILADGYSDLKNYRKEFSNKTIISSIIRLKANATIVEIPSKKHYKLYESVIFYIRFIFMSYLCNKLLVREKFKGEFFVYSYLTGSCEEKVKNRDFYVNRFTTKISGNLEEIAEKRKTSCAKSPN